MEKKRVSNWVRLSLFVFFVFGLWGSMWTSAEGAEYTYIPEHRVGDFKVYIDDTLAFRAYWKGINLIDKWGDIYTPVVWGFRKGGWGKSYGDFNPEKADMIWRHLIPTTPIRVEKKDGGVEYLWSLSRSQSDFKPGDTQELPVRKNYRHLGADFKQINRVFVAPNRVTLDMTLEFTNPPVMPVIFYPVLFPGTGAGRHYYRENRILGKECTVVNKDGTEKKIIYPKESESFRWLTDEPRSLTFQLDEGVIQYNFSFSDPEASLLFYGFTGWPDVHPYKPYKVPAIVGKLVIPVKEGLKNGRYKCSVRMEILVGDAVKAEIDPPGELPLDACLNVGIESKKPSFLFFKDEPLCFNIIVDGIYRDKKRDLTIRSRVINYGNEEVFKKEFSLSLPAECEKDTELLLPEIGNGIFALEVSLLETRRVVGYNTVRFSVVDRPYEYPSEKSFFGVMDGSVRGATPEEVEKVAPILRDIGVKRMRVNWNNINWKQVEKEKGKIVFPPFTGKIEVLKKCGVYPWVAPASFEERVGDPVPEWARSDKRIPSNPSARWVFSVPKDFNDWENYCYHVAKRFKGKIDTFELENESAHFVGEDKKHFLQIETHAYKGIKRANPDAVVIDGSICGLHPHKLDWLDSFLQNAKDEGLRICDVIAPHYMLSSGTISSPTTSLTPPEEKLENLKKVVQIAKKFNVRLWNGENGSQQTYEGIFPHREFLEMEKDFVNCSMREYLLMKAFGVEQVNVCSGLMHFPHKLHCQGYWEPHAARLWGRGNFLKPWAVAHAAMASILEGAEFKERIDKGFEDFYCMVYTRGEENIAALWMKEEKATWKVKLPKGIEYRNIVGASKPVSGRQSFAITEEPFYLVSKDKTDKFVKVLSSGSFNPDKLISLGKVQFSKDRKSLEVMVKNNCAKEVTVDSISIVYGKNKDTLEKVEIPGKREIAVPFRLKKEIKYSLFAKVKAEAGGKKFRKEQFVFFPSIKSAKSYGYLIALKTEEPVSIDGDLSDWNGAVPISLNRKDQVIFNGKYKKVNKWKGAGDLSAIGYVMWDDKNFYFACQVTDDTYANPYTGRDSGWRGDSIQIAFDPKMDNPGYGGYNNDDQEINISLSGKEPFIFRRTFGSMYKVAKSTGGAIKGAKLAIKRWDKGLVYELSVPIKELSPLKGEKTEVIRFNFIMNDNDGDGRRMWMGITPGIGEKKDPTKYKKLIFLE